MKSLFFKLILVTSLFLTLNNIFAVEDLTEMHTYKKSSSVLKQTKIQELEVKNKNSLDTIRYLAARNLELKNKIQELEKRLNQENRNDSSYAELLSLVKN